MIWCIRLCLSLTLLALSATFAAAADDKTEIEKKTDELKQQQALLEAQTALLEARFPTFESGKEGTLTKGEGGLYPLGAWQQVYLRLAQSAEDICNEVVEVKGATRTRVALVSIDDLDQVGRFRAVRYEQQAILTAIGDLLRSKSATPSPPSGPGVASVAAAPIVVESLLSVAKLFRTDRVLRSESVTIATTALLELVHACLMRRNQSMVAYPAITGLYAAATGTPTPFSRDVLAILAARAQLQPIADDATDKERAVTTKALLARSDKFVADLYAPPAPTARPPIDNLLHGEATVAAVQPPAQLLIVSIAQQGGSSMVTSSVWHSDRLFVGGGAIVTYQLIDDGALIASRTVMKVDPEFRRVPLE